MKYYFITFVVTDQNNQQLIFTTYFKTNNELNIIDAENTLKTKHNFKNAIIVNFIEVNKTFVNINCPDLIDK